MRPGEIADAVLAFLKDKITEPDPQTIRLGIGLTLAGIHSAILHSAQTQEEKQEAAGEVMDSIKKLTEALQRDIERIGGIEGLTIITEESKEPNQEGLH